MDDKITITSDDDKFTYRREAEAFQSENLNELFAALAKTQGEMEEAEFNSSNPFFKSRFSDLASVVKASRPYLTKNGLCVIHRILPDDHGQSCLRARLGHSSGQWIDSQVPINPPKQDIQSIGSYISYLRRYTYAALVGVVSSDEDDDGERAMKRNGQPQMISESEVRHIEQLLLKLDVSEKDKVLSWCQVGEIKDINKTKYEAVVKNLNLKIKTNGDK